MGQINIGISKIEFADPEVDGSMPADGSFSSLGYTVEDSTSYTVEDGNTTEYRVEELSIPLDVQRSGGRKYFTFTIADPDLTTAQALMGGSVDTDTSEWMAPDTEVDVEKAFKLTPFKGIGFKAALTSVRAKFTSALGKNNYLGIEVTVEIKKSVDPAEPPLRLFNVAP